MDSVLYWITSSVDEQRVGMFISISALFSSLLKLSMGIVSFIAIRLDIA